MNDLRALLFQAAELAAAYLESLDDRPVFPRVPAAELEHTLDATLPDHPTDPTEVIRALATAAEPGLTSVAGSRYFGFVTGGSVPAALTADWLATAWDQNASSYTSSPAAAVTESVACRWILDVLRLPSDASVALVTGCQMAHVTALAAARHRVLRDVGWDVPRRGVAGSPPIRVVMGEKRHITVDRGLRLLGIGRDAIQTCDVDAQGRVVPASFERILRAGAGPTIVVAQAGEVNTGSCDPMVPMVDAARSAGAWIHVDGAFGIWARVSPKHEHLVEGLGHADSWAFDAHKWLNVPYDSGIAVVADPEAHRAAMVGEAAYYGPTSEHRNAFDWTPEASRRARGFAVYAALRSLGRSGLVALVERCCAHARRFAEALAQLPGAEILNDVVLNQVLVRFASDEETDAVLCRVQASGVAWMGSTVWNDRSAIRISVSSHATTDQDVARTVAAFTEAVRA